MNEEFPARDFTKFRNFPGTTNNELDTVLHGFERIQTIPAPLFAFLLVTLAFAFAQLNWKMGLLFSAFFLSDWLLLELLPHFHKSFGPAKPPVTLLAIGRCVFLLLPWPVSLGFQFLGTLLVIYGFWIEPHQIIVSHQELISPKLQPSTKLRILHLGDLHIERITQREKKLNHLVLSLKPDLILFSGDFLNLSYLTDATAQQHVRQILEEWQAPLGVFGVKGSPAVDLDEGVAAVTEDMPIRMLESEKVAIPMGSDTIELVGLSCSHKPFLDFPEMRQVVQSNPEHFTILLYHSPDLAPHAAELGIDLQLSGHTHGGQVRVPWFGALLTGSLYGRKFQSGRYAIQKLVLYITRGIGMEGAGAPRVRFLCPPEIIVWEITGANP